MSRVFFCLLLNWDVFRFHGLQLEGRSEERPFPGNLFRLGRPDDDPPIVSAGADEVAVDGNPERGDRTLVSQDLGDELDFVDVPNGDEAGAASDENHPAVEREAVQLLPEIWKEDPGSLTRTYHLENWITRATNISNEWSSPLWIPTGTKRTKHYKS